LDTNLYGGEDNHLLRPLAYPGTDVFIIAFSIVSRESFVNVKEKWIVELKQFDPNSRVPILLVGMKADLRKDEEMMKQLAKKRVEMVTEEEARQCAQKIGAAGYYECSALAQEGLTPLFEEVVRVGRVKQASEPERKTCAIL
jgi:small GTP-binding protein